MKNAYKLLIILLLSSSARAQIRFGIEGGMNINKLKSDGLFATIEVKQKDHFTVRGKIGVMTDIGINDHFALQTGIYYSGKGGKTEYSFSDPGYEGKATFRTTIDYLELPLLFSYKRDAGLGKLFWGIGPYIDFGIGSKMKLNAVSQDDFGGNIKFDSTVNLKFGGDSEKIKRTDVGGCFNIGYEMNNGLFVRLSYQHGFINLSNVTDYTTTSMIPENMKNRNLSVTVGYMFGDLKRKK